MSAYTFITQLYVGYFNRAPDPQGLAYWEGVYASGALGLLDIARAFAVAPEFAGPGDMPSVSPEALIAQSYRNLFLRSAEPDGIIYWRGELDRQKIDAESLIASIAFSGSSAGVGADALALAHRTFVAESYLEALQISGQPFSTASATAVVGKVGRSDLSLEDGLAEIEAFVGAGSAPEQPLAYVLSSNFSAVQEGAASGNVITIKVTRTGDVSAPSALEIVETGSATNGLDYVLTGLEGSQIAFAAHERVSLIKLTTRPDQLQEGDEVVMMSLRSLSGGSIVGELSITLKDTGFLEANPAPPILDKAWEFDLFS